MAGVVPFGVYVTLGLLLPMVAVAVGAFQNNSGGFTFSNVKAATHGVYLHGRLSPESVRTLALQGGPMTPGQAAAFEALPFARDAVAVRRWDDEAKDPAITPPAFAHFASLLQDLARA